MDGVGPVDVVAIGRPPAHERGAGFHLSVSGVVRLPPPWSPSFLRILFFAQYKWQKWVRASFLILKEKLPGFHRV